MLRSLRGSGLRFVLPCTMRCGLTLPRAGIVRTEKRVRAIVVERNGFLPGAGP